MYDVNTVHLHASEDDFFVFYKPAGVSFHSEQCAGFVVLAEKLVNEKLYPVHRLDKVTSGLIILARNKEAAAEFTTLFSDHKINKFYLAVSDAKPKKKQGWIKGDMQKSRRGAFKLLKTQTNPAITRFYSTSIRPGLRAYLLKPYSGKTHQLRVAMKSLGAPILGDSTYAGSKDERTNLHAYALQFSYKGQLKEYRCGYTFGSHLNEVFNADEFQEWFTPWTLDW
ncbi:MULTISPECIES: TIGR01621 family pseudouridine synthase [Pseudoalteromonas]|jgi:tRNA pseudouridine32 synthase/23S rRNA pseudouridine746 synthase|uniref:RNA pseudouridine synthase n=1 Tax=Pseudoalteromonas gelatinilytica TaxID=1703256 RepID=A0A3A3F687_9GAMM|nr:MULTISPECIES: TIGR01621 family pseudouridine synthase [Pseudoalteromonas]RJF36942.1 TIGR01621 family pseudouridine synthase [Pseudoalteromonas profundi]GGE88427.1 RNA pseudouridine synthase [Pseudoalteromonas profundi]